LRLFLILITVKHFHTLYIIYYAATDLLSDLLFALASLVSRNKAENKAGIAAIVFTLFPIMLNSAVVVRFMRSKLRDEDFRAWARRNSGVYDTVLFLGVVSPHLVRLIGSGLRGLDMFSANLSNTEVEKLKFQSRVVVLVEDLPMLVIVALLQSTEQSWSPVMLFSLLTSSLSLLYTSSVTLSSAMMVASAKGRSPEAILVAHDADDSDNDFGEGDNGSFSDIPQALVVLENASSSRRSGEREVFGISI
jgi:hypothetical protein